MSHSPDLLLRFTPHVPERATATGWTPDRQRCFIAALARTGVVSAAARSVGMTPRSAYQLRDRVRHAYGNGADAPMRPETAEQLGPGDSFSFAAAWDMALRHAPQRQPEAALPATLPGERAPAIRRNAIDAIETPQRDAQAPGGAPALSPTLSPMLSVAARIRRIVEAIEHLERTAAAPPPEPSPPDPSPPAPSPPEAPEDHRARKRHERWEKRIYGPRHHGLLDYLGPANRPPRTLARQAADARPQPPSPSPPPPPRPEPAVRKL